MPMTAALRASRVYPPFIIAYVFHLSKPSHGIDVPGSCSHSFHFEGTRCKVAIDSRQYYLLDRAPPCSGKSSGDHCSTHSCTAVVWCRVSLLALSDCQYRVAFQAEALADVLFQNLCPYGVSRTLMPPQPNLSR